LGVVVVFTIAALPQRESSVPELVGSVYKNFKGVIVEQVVGAAIVQGID
jgi:hypothetical protein